MAYEVKLMENKQHLIALDLDGTLLTDKKEISPRTKQTIIKAMEAGHVVVIATGRPHRSSIPYYHTLGLDTPMVNFNGALIHHPRDDKWDALHTPMPKRTALKIVEACYEVGVHNIDRKSTRLNSVTWPSRMPSSACKKKSHRRLN